MRPFSSSTKEPQKLISSFFLLTHQVCSRSIIPKFRSCSYLFCYTCFGLSALHKLMFQIIANGSYNLRAYSTATVLVHSLPIAKVLHITFLRIFLLNHLTMKNLTSCFLFFALAQNGAEKRKTTAALTQTFTMLASYKHPSQSILQRCIAIRLARPTIALLPLPVLRKRRLYI